MKKRFLLLAALPFAALPSPAAIVQYTDRTAFLAALQTGYFSTDFSTLTPGDQTVTSLSFSGGTPSISVEISSRNFSSSGPGDNLWVADLGDIDAGLGAATTYSDSLRITAPSFYAVGGDWFLGDLDDNFTAGAVTLAFSEGTTVTLNNLSLAGSFRGFLSDTPLTGVDVLPPDPNLTGGWVTVDNLVVGNAVPEPGSAVLAGLVSAGLMLRRDRRR